MCPYYSGVFSVQVFHLLGNIFDPSAHHVGCLGLQNKPDNTPRITPPKINPGHPVLIYPGLALKYAQRNEGIIPSMIIIDISSSKILVVGGLVGSLGAIGFLSLLPLLTILASILTEDVGGRYLGLALFRAHSLHTPRLESLVMNALPSQTFPQYDDEMRSSKTSIPFPSRINPLSYASCHSDSEGIDISEASHMAKASESGIASLEIS